MRTVGKRIIYMKKLFTPLAVSILLTFISCERHSNVTPQSAGEDISIIDEQSPINGVWKYQLNGGEMTLEYGDHNVKYRCYVEIFDATAIYEGTYTIKDNEITHEFTSLTTKNSSRIEYTSPEKMPKEAVLQDENTIIYMDYLFTRE